MLRTSIDSVIDIEAFNADLEAERRDSTCLEGVRRQMNASLTSMVEDLG